METGKGVTDVQGSDTQQGLGCLFGVLAVALAALVSVAVGMFAGAGFGVLAAAAFTAAAIVFVMLEFKKTMG